VEKHFEHYISSPIGWLKIISNSIAIKSIAFEAVKGEIDSEKPPVLLEAVLQLEAYFRGEKPPFDFAIDPEGTAFQKQVWQFLVQIDYGKTINYLELALLFEDKNKTRAVAAANGANPLAIVVPCHRVIGKDGSMTGYAGEIWRKKWLLEHEGFLKQTTLQF